MSSSNYTFNNIKKVDIIVQKRQEIPEIMLEATAKSIRGKPISPFLIEALPTRETQVTSHHPNKPIIQVPI